MAWMTGRLPLILSRSACWKPLVLLSQHHQLDRVELLFDKGKSLFRIQGPKVRSSRRMMSGPIREDSKVVSQGELWNQDSNQPCWASLSLFLHSNPCLTLAMDSRTTPV